MIRCQVVCVALACVVFVSGVPPCGCSREGRPRGGLPDVPRERTLVLDCPDSGVGTGQYADWNSFNPFIPGGISRTGYNFVYEPLYFYNAYRDELIPWVAEGHSWNATYTEVAIRIRKGVEWSDGRPWTAHDLVFTLDMLRRNAPFLAGSTDIAATVDELEALDDHTARISLKRPSPRFVFDHLTNKFITGVTLVPRHVWEGRDPKTFRNLDIAGGSPVVSGPYRLVQSIPSRKVWDLRRDWWAARIGFRPLPKVERIIYLTYMGEPQRVERLVADELDSSLELRAANIEALLERNPRVTTWSGRQKPYGYLDHWPVSLGFNVLEKPYSEAAFRRAVAFAIDRRQLVEVGYRGAGEATLVPFPEFPAMRPYVEALGDLFEKHSHGQFDPARSAELMERSGWRRGESGFWERAGERASVPIEGYVYIFQDIAPVLVEQLRRAGFDASFRTAVDCYSRMATGQARAFLCGTSGSVKDPCATLLLFHSRHVRPTGAAASTFWRWSNPRFDSLVERLAELPAEDPRFMELYREAMDIWLGELPAVPLVAWHQRVPYNETRWKGWPTAANPYVNGAYWHKTFLLVLLGLEPVHP